MRGNRLSLKVSRTPQNGKRSCFGPNYGFTGVNTNVDEAMLLASSPNSAGGGRVAAAAVADGGGNGGLYFRVSSDSASVSAVSGSPAPEISADLLSQLDKFNRVVDEVYEEASRTRWRRSLQWLSGIAPRAARSAIYFFNALVSAVVAQGRISTRSPGQQHSFESQQLQCGDPNGNSPPVLPKAGGGSWCQLPDDILLQLMQICVSDIDSRCDGGSGEATAGSCDCMMTGGSAAAGAGLKDAARLGLGCKRLQTLYMIMLRNHPELSSKVRGNHSLL